jgi:hypothetical protein
MVLSTVGEYKDFSFKNNRIFSINTKCLIRLVMGMIQFSIERLTPFFKNVKEGEGA